MSFPRYPAYKNSGVKWLGEIPERWEVLALKRCVARIESGTSVNAVDSPASDGEYGVLKTSCVYTGEFDPDENKAVLPEEYERVSCPLLAGTLIVSRMNTPDLVGAAGLVREAREGIFLPDRLWQIQLLALDPRFVHRWTQSGLYRAQVQMACSGTSASMQNLAQHQFGAFLLAAPPLCEQTTIATFLDRETAKIDALVAEQEKLIALLQEKRQAVISHAVTKGLDPNVPMKDSGVEWLGEVPAHWCVASIKRFCTKITDGAHISPETEGGIYSFVSTKDILDDHIDFDGALLTSIESYEYLERTGCRPLRGDVLFSKDGTIGRTVMVSDQRKFVVASSLIILRPDPSLLDPRFLDYLCKSSTVSAQVQAFVKGAGLPRVSIQNLMKVLGIFPPLAEQTAIAAYLDDKTAESSALIAFTQSAIVTLQERRAALISAAVTGQIDVRGLAAAA